MIAGMVGTYQRALALQSKGCSAGVAAAGTGSAGFAISRIPRETVRLSWPVLEPQPPMALPGQARTAEASLGRVRVVFGSSMTELANLLSVSRQALYGWQGGGNISPENAAKLDDLALAADVVAGCGVALPPGILRRRVPGLGSIAEALKAGKSAVEVAHKLAEVLVVEARQRQRLEARLKGRAAPPSAEFPPAMDERSA